jgi:hypothetical protein
MGKYVYYADKSNQQPCEWPKCKENGATHSKLYALRKDVMSSEPIKWCDDYKEVHRSAREMSVSSSYEFWHDFDNRKDNNLPFEPAFVEARVTKKQPVFERRGKFLVID